MIILLNWGTTNAEKQTKQQKKQIEMLCTKDRRASKKPRVDKPVHVLYKKLCNVSSFTKMANFLCHGICIQSLEFNVGG